MVTQKKKSPDYRSKFEETVGTFLGPLAEHEPEKIYFIEPEKKRYYLPDFKLTNGIFLETKGRWVAADRKKHLWLKEQHPDKRIIIIFQNSKVTLTKKSKTTYGEWATKNNIEWYDWKSGIPARILKPNANKLDSGDTRRSSRNNSKPKRRASKIPTGSGS